MLTIVFLLNRSKKSEILNSGSDMFIEEMKWQKRTGEKVQTKECFFMEVHSFLLSFTRGLMRDTLTLEVIFYPQKRRVKSIRISSVEHRIE